MSMISHSSVQKLQSCGWLYDFHYNKRFRSMWQPSTFTFGKAIDDGLNALLSCHGTKEQDRALDFAIEAFQKSWEVQDVKYKPTKLMDYIWLDYKKYDLDWDFIDEFELETLTELAEKLKFREKPFDLFERIKKKYNSILHGSSNIKHREVLKRLSINERKFYNAVHWCSCRHRGILMIEAYYRKVMPLIKKVIYIQKKVILKNKAGDNIDAYVDTQIIFKDNSHAHIMDNKTSNYDYEEDSVITSPQLSLYCYLEELDHAGFFVLKKKPIKTIVKTCKKCGVIKEASSRVKTCAEDIKGKRCLGEFHISKTMEMDIQIIRDKIPYETQEMVLTVMDAAIKDIKTKRFVPNFSFCQHKYGYCEFYDKCWKGKELKEIDMEVLPEKEHDNKE